MKRIYLLILLSIAFASATLLYLLGDEITFFKTKPTLIYENCGQMMAHNTCSIMLSSPNFSPSVKQIYLPKYGPLDADIYRNLLKSGAGMCKTIKESCLQDLESEICKLGIVLYADK